MKSQEYNKGELDSLTVNIDKEIVESVKRMAKKSGRSIDDIVVIALRRYKASHSDDDGSCISAD